MMRQKSARRWAAVLLAGVVSACAGNSPWGDTAGVNAVTDERARGVFRAPEFANVPVRRIEYQDRFQREEYNFFQAENGARAEFIYATTLELLGDQSILEFNDLVRQTLKTWNYNQDNISLASSSVLVSDKGLPGAYHRYTHTGENRDCFGYVMQWEPERFDRFFRDDKAIFGYYCAPKGQPLSEGQVADLYQKIGVLGVTEPGGQAVFTTTAPVHSNAQLQIARFGTPSDKATKSGNAEFPFRLQDFFTIKGGGTG